MPKGLLGRVPSQVEDAATIHLPFAAARVDLRLVPRPPTAVPATPASPTLSTSPTPTASATSTPRATPTTAGYTEPLTDFPSIRDLRGRYESRRWYETLLDLLERRYATGRAIVVRLDDSRAQAGRWANGRTDTFDDLLDASQLIVHEMDHQLGWQEGLAKSAFTRYAFVVREDLQVDVTRHETFNRSEIAQYVTGGLANRYKSTYLTGQSGQQGFFTLLDEFNAYTHSLFVGYGLSDEFRGRRISHRDGVVTMMMYTEFYLRHAEENHADVYARLHDDPEVRALVDLLWSRAMFILDVTAELPQLALDPATVEAEMRKPDMLAAVARFVAP